MAGQMTIFRNIDYFRVYMLASYRTTEGRLVYRGAGVLGDSWMCVCNAWIESR